MIENTANLKRDICDERKKEILLVYYIFIYRIFLGRYDLKLHWALSLSFRLIFKVKYHIFRILRNPNPKKTKKL